MTNWLASQSTNIDLTLNKCEIMKQKNQIDKSALTKSLHNLKPFVLSNARNNAVIVNKNFAGSVISLSKSAWMEFRNCFNFQMDFIFQITRDRICYKIAENSLNFSTMKENFRKLSLQRRFYTKIHFNQSWRQTK